MILYHVTDREHVESILKEGLAPSIGENSALVGEENALVYLCDEQSIPYWAFLLGKDTVLKIDAPCDMASRMEECHYSLYSEYTGCEQIPPEYISRHSNGYDVPYEVKKQVCMSYIDSISRMCVAVVRYFEFGDDDEEETEELKWDIRSGLIGLKRLDYSLLTEKEVRSHLLENASEGEYVLTDKYRDTDIPLWQMLTVFEGPLKEERTELSDWVRDNLAAKGLDIDTGAWDS